MKPLEDRYRVKRAAAALFQWLRQDMLPLAEVRQTKDEILSVMELPPYFEKGTIRINRGMDDMIHPLSSILKAST